MNPQTPPRKDLTEKLEIVQGHLLVERDGRLCLLDTGVPSETECPGMVRRLLGRPIDVLLGCEELRESVLTIDWPARELRHDAPLPEDCVTVALRPALFGIPLVTIHTADGIAQEAVFDTGAMLSYAPERAVRGLAAIRRITDFLPGLGEFEVDVYEVPITIGGIPLRLECGVLPPMLQMALMLLCPTGWIVGSALLRDRVVALDLAGEQLHIGRQVG